MSISSSGTRPTDSAADERRQSDKQGGGGIARRQEGSQTGRWTEKMEGQLFFTCALYLAVRAHFNWTDTVKCVWSGSFWQIEREGLSLAER